MKKTVVVKEDEWIDSRYRTSDWEKSVEIITWEHDFVNKKYTIVYKEKI